MFEPVTILGVDTAIRKTGYAVLRLTAPGHYEVADCGLIRNGKDLLHSECLRRLSGGIREIVNAFHPDSASIEMAFVSKNIRTAMILSLARGAVIASLAESSVPIYEYSPKTAKRAAVGRGEASKEQVAATCALPCKPLGSQRTSAFSRSPRLTPLPEHINQRRFFVYETDKIWKT